MGLDGGFLKFTRLEPRHEPVEERIKHFNEFIAIYSDTEGRECAAAVDKWLRDKQSEAAPLWRE